MQSSAQTKPWNREAVAAIVVLFVAGLMMIPTVLPWLWVAFIGVSAAASVMAIRKTASGEYRGRILAIVSLSLIGLLVLFFLFVALGGLKLF